MRHHFRLLLSLGLIIAALYWTQAFLIPVALALLLTFLLTPVTAWLEKFGLGRVAAVLLVVVFVFSLLGTVAWIVASQFTDVANQLPAYRNNIKQKIADIRGAGKGGALEKVKETAKQVSDELSKEQSKLPKPREVVVQSDESRDSLAFIGCATDARALGGRRICARVGYFHARSGAKIYATVSFACSAIVV